jgi:tetratricopeptide (TPR) repeat protein
VGRPRRGARRGVSPRRAAGGRHPDRPGRARGRSAAGGTGIGDIAAHPDRVEVEIAEAHYRQALALAEALGLRPLLAHCHLGLGVLYRRIGKRDEAREHLTTAGTMFGEMDMRFWREQAEAELKELA